MRPKLRKMGRVGFWRSENKARSWAALCQRLRRLVASIAAKNSSVGWAETGSAGPIRWQTIAVRKADFLPFSCHHYHYLLPISHEYHLYYYQALYPYYRLLKLRTALDCPLVPWYCCAVPEMSVTYHRPESRKVFGTNSLTWALAKALLSNDVTSCNAGCGCSYLQMIASRLEHQKMGREQKGNLATRKRRAQWCALVCHEPGTVKLVPPQAAGCFVPSTGHPVGRDGKE
ncbi:hypothetical protein LY78DRAFT_118344 [Colletotrichum sublineola]|nr:hypothetical protein LY78DRAFT_118344 [Colletotrichum sublineola]